MRVLLPYHDQNFLIHTEVDHNPLVLSVWNHVLPVIEFYNLGRQLNLIEENASRYKLLGLGLKKNLDAVGLIIAGSSIHFGKV